MPPSLLNVTLHCHDKSLNLQDIVQDAKDALDAPATALLLGAGISTEVKLPQWKDLLADMLRALNVSPSYEINPSTYLEAAGIVEEKLYSLQQKDVRDRFEPFGILLDEGACAALARRSTPIKLAAFVRLIFRRRIFQTGGLSATQRPPLNWAGTTGLLARRCVERVVNQKRVIVATYNYDNLFEYYLFNERRHDPQKTWIYEYEYDGGLRKVHGGRDSLLMGTEPGVVLLYVHGRIPLFDSGVNNAKAQGAVVLSADSYYALAETHRAGFTNLMQHAIFASTPCLMAGFSADDANFLLQRKRLQQSNMLNEKAFTLSYCGAKQSCSFCYARCPSANTMRSKVESLRYKRLDPIPAQKDLYNSIIEELF